MYKDRAENSKNNIANQNIERLCKNLRYKTLQRQFAEML